ncbi:GNAT family N-acetyltransferase [Actinophytocola sp. NPDC049390]|uniref:GNAT family N-acetyltransferase n=1 Tax=Actinophytocola sp. NPDC049390 TaxID=3363894 RepID=UPI003792BA17
MLYSAKGDEITAAELYPLLRLRVDVFVVEQECPYPELDGRDLSASTVHVWWRPGDEVLGYLRLLRDDDGTHRIGRVCTALSARGSGLGALLMKAAMDRVGDEAAVLAAQTYALDFYARFGFVPEGDRYLEDGIEHQTMRRAAVTGARA